MIQNLFRRLFGLRYCVGMDERGNKYFIQKSNLLKKDKRTVEVQNPINSVEDVPAHWRMWLYHRIELPPVDYTEKITYIPPDIAPDYDPYDPKAQKLCVEYIEYLKSKLK